MANTLSPLLPTLISQYFPKYLANRNGMLGRVFVETIQENRLAGGNAVTIPKPTTIFTPTDVNYASAAAAQDIGLGSVSLSFSNHKEVKVSLTELESRVAQGNAPRIFELYIKGVLDGLFSAVDQSLTALYSSYAYTQGTYNTALTDATVRAAVNQLATNKVDVQNQDVFLITDPTAYWTDLLGIDRFSQAQIIGDNSVIRAGKLPTIYGAQIDYSQNIATTSISGVTTEHNLLFTRDAFVIGFVQFNPATEFGANAPVDEKIMIDPLTGTALRMQRYYDPQKRTGYAQFDIMWGVNVVDSKRFIRVQSGR